MEDDSNQHPLKNRLTTWFPILVEDLLVGAKTYATVAPRSRHVSHQSRSTQIQKQDCLDELWTTYLVIYFLISTGKCDILGEAVSHTLQLLALRPVIESTSHVDLGGGMVPARRSDQ